jgi:hypothetical protein
MSAQYSASFFIVPARIMNLPELTIQLLKFYEKIFHFWHSGCECFVGNKVLMEYAGMKSTSSVADAFQYFESHGEMKREIRNGRRFISAPLRELEIDRSSQDEKLSTYPLAVARPPSRCSETPPLAVARHSNNKLNKKLNINKSSCKKDQKKNNHGNQERHSFADSMDAMANEKRHIDKNDELKRAKMPDNLRGIQISRIKNENENESKSTVPWFNNNH